MESGNRSACNRHKQDREHISHLGILKSGVSRKVHGRVCNHQTDNGTDDHTSKHKGCHEITRLHQKPHRHNSCQEDICKSQIRPGVFACNQRECHADCKSSNGTCQSGQCFFPSGQMKMLLHQTKYHSEHDEHQGNGTCCTIRLCCRR